MRDIGRLFDELNQTFVRGRSVAGLGEGVAGQGDRTAGLGIVGALAHDAHRPPAGRGH
jgi:hypothetical protein